MDIRSGAPYPAGTLSNFSRHSFTFRCVEVSSMEGLLQSLKFKDPNMQKYICTLSGIGAKRAGANKNWQKSQILWWNGEPIERSSDAYQKLLDEAYESMFVQNGKARKALLATNSATLKHSIGRTKKSETVLTVQEFCSRLTRIRESFQKY